MRSEKKREADRLRHQRLKNDPAYKALQIAKRKRRQADPVHRIKINARARVRNRVRRKTWPHVSVFTCSDCVDRAQEYHHEDYSLWWSVEPLCKSCHLARHI